MITAISTSVQKLKIRFSFTVPRPFSRTEYVHDSTKVAARNHGESENIVIPMASM